MPRAGDRGEGLVGWALPTAFPSNVTLREVVGEAHPTKNAARERAG
jgi:hypothetical protein